MMKTVLITGATGFIGQAVLENLSQTHCVVGTYWSRGGVERQFQHRIVEYLHQDMLDTVGLEKICREKRPDIVIHCAGIAHQKLISNLPDSLYDKVNHRAAVEFARTAGQLNPNLYFIFLSSVSVYGCKKDSTAMSEADPCYPDSIYGKSKLACEIGLKRLFAQGGIGRLDILRLAPVYGPDHLGNLEKRVRTPFGKLYMRISSGEQRMSILSVQNLVDFIRFRLDTAGMDRACTTINVSDARPCSMNDLIRLFAAIQADGKSARVITISENALALAADAMGRLFRKKREWISSCYAKLANDSIFDNYRMYSTGFVPRQSLASVFGLKEA